MSNNQTIFSKLCICLRNIWGQKYKKKEKTIKLSNLIIKKEKIKNISKVKKQWKKESYKEERILIFNW